MIIDCHTHFYDPSRPQGVPWPSADSKELYFTCLPQHYKALKVPEQVSGTVVVEASAWLEDNQWILDLAAEDPFIVGLVGHIDPGTEGFIRNVDRFAADPIFCGIRVGGQYFEDIEQGNFLNEMEHLAAQDLELDVMLGFEALPGLSKLARRLPGLRIVINHVAGIPINGETPDSQAVENIQEAAEQPQVYCKVSGLVEVSQVKPPPHEVEFYTPLLDMLWDAFGEDRLIYGSNWPVSAMFAPLDQVQRIVTTYIAARGPEAAEKYFWRNSQAAYKWVKRS
jgi:L-fuconolactonase